MDEVGGQDVSNGAISMRASSGMRGCHRKRGCAFFRPRIFHSPTWTVRLADERPCFSLALAVILRVIYSLLDVRTRVEGCSCVNCRVHEQSVLPQLFGTT